MAESESPDRGMSGALTAARLERRKASGTTALAEDQFTQQWKLSIYYPVEA
jgi:hypothetical protein